MLGDTQRVNLKRLALQPSFHAKRDGRFHKPLRATQPPSAWMTLHPV